MNEFLADRASTEFNGNSHGLAQAFAKLGTYSKQIPMTARPETAHMFIVNPLSKKSMANLFSTHPSIEEGIARLEGNDFHAPDNRNQPQRNPHKGREGMDAQARNFWDRLK